jgi:hypothetical protein
LWRSFENKIKSIRKEEMNMKRNNMLMLRTVGIFILICTAFVCYGFTSEHSGWVVVDTGQDKCYDHIGREIPCPGAGSGFYGQDAQYSGFQPSCTDNGDGTVTDNNTGLMWQKTPGSKMTWEDAVKNASSFNLAGYTDWRLPTIKELYSLMDFTGVTGFSASVSIPYIDTAYFDFSYGDPLAGERFIDAQYCSATEYVGTTMNGNITIFGVNFADGRIKGYPKYNKLYYVRYVRGSTGYGSNRFVDNNDGTISDLSTGLMWMKNDSGHLKAGDNGDGKLDWQQALDWAENLEYAGYTGWRLPNAKELQSIVDYTRSPGITGSPAIDPVFNTTSIIDGNGQVNYPYFWTGTTHPDGMSLGSTAVYIAFGEAQGYMRTPTGSYILRDVHGAGAQRSDPKSGDPDDFPYGRGPQGDVISIYNYVRCVRDISDNTSQETPKILLSTNHLIFRFVRVGKPPHPQSLSIRNSGAGTLNWTVEADAAWLKIKPDKGTGFGTVGVFVEGRGLVPGIYTGTITVSDANASNSPQTVTVRFHVN